MKTIFTHRKRHLGGFTLIELLVVVAIIALLISILLPSLSKARAQARTTLCASRLGQITKAMLVYADDFEETPPFVGVGFEDIGDNKDWWGEPAMDYWAEHEDWLFEKGVMRLIWLLPEVDWADASGDRAEIRFGSLFPYTRFEKLYLCPEFERTPSKEQGVFNYTRAVTGRKVLSEFIGDPNVDEIDPGPIMKVSAIHSPSAMFMMLDEQWDFHVGGNYLDYGFANILDGTGWMAADSIQGIICDMVGSYHSTKGREINLTDKPELIMESKKGNIGHYDGHVELVRDPWPWRNLTDSSIGDLTSLLGDPEALKIANILLQEIFAQRGIPFTVEDALKFL